MAGGGVNASYTTPTVSGLGTEGEGPGGGARVRGGGRARHGVGPQEGSRAHRPGDRNDRASSSVFFSGLFRLCLDYPTPPPGML